MMYQYIFGIDFGTSNSCVSYYDSEKVVVVPNDMGQFITPSCISIDNSDIIIGQLQTNNSITNLKRLLGMTYQQYKQSIFLFEFFKKRNIQVQQDEYSQFCSIRIDNDKSISVHILIKYIIQYLQQIAESFSGQRMEKVVITAPAYYSDSQRQILKCICEELGFQVVRIINEPTAAGLAYFNLNMDLQHQEENVLVIDCGGGTTDISLINLDYQLSVSEVLSVQGDNFLGGEDLTNVLVDYIINKLNQMKKTPTSKQVHWIKRECEKVKCQLSYNTHETFCIESMDLIIPVSRVLFESLCESFLKKIENLVQEVVFGYTVDKVILVGGTTRMPQFTSFCTQHFPGVTVCNTLDPDQTISIGASVQGALLNKDEVSEKMQNMSIVDVVNMSFGVEIRGGIMSPIISKNSPIPTTKTHIFTNSSDFVNTITIDVYQGDRKFVKDNTHLASLVLSELDDTLKKGEMHIHVTFSIDADGILSITAKDERTDKSCSVRVENVSNASVYEEVPFHIIMGDNEKMNQVLAKMELFDTFNELLKTFHENSELLGFNDNTKLFAKAKLNELYNDTFNVILNYNEYSAEDLKQYTIDFKDKWHKLIIDFDPDMDFGGTKI